MTHNLITNKIPFISQLVGLLDNNLNTVQCRQFSVRSTAQDVRSTAQDVNDFRRKHWYAVTRHWSGVGQRLGGGASFIQICNVTIK